MTNGDGKFSWKDSVTLKEYFEDKIDELEKGMALRIQSLEKATDLAKAGMDERLARMNEFRDALKDQSNTFLTRQEAAIRMDRIDEDIRSLRESRSELFGKASQNQLNVALLIGVAGLVLSIISVWQYLVH
jgi:hypothetical protein